MSRSYHVTRRTAKRAFAEGDTAPMFDASDKAGIKIREKQQRHVAVGLGKRTKNSTVVAEERALTKRVGEK
jgi:hypothetical protein